MRWRVERKSNILVRFLNALVAGVCAIVLSLLPVGLASAQTAGAGSLIGATICGSSSSIVLAQPISDSIVTLSTVSLQGSVHQASQIEVRVDGTFDSTIPISVGQTAFSGSVELSAGTHTILLTAINVCSGSNAEATAVVTYTAPPEIPSGGGGSSTPTNTGVVSQGVRPSLNSDSTNYNPTVLDQLTQPLQTIAEWLNIGAGDVSSPQIETMQIGQAATLAAGMTLAVIGVSPAVVANVVNLPVIANLLPFTPTPQRIFFIARGGRIIGILLLFGTLFL